MDIKYILFDLDGTLTDPAAGITNSVEYALSGFGIAVKNKNELNKFIGPPLKASFEKYYGFTEEQSVTAVEYYREYYKDKGIFENYVYKGLELLLKQLKENGKVLIVATSKPTVFAKQILDHFDLSKYFSFIAGSELDGTRVKKDEVIAFALSECGITDLSQAVMVGDREYDILGAKHAGIRSVGVLYGYGDLTELQTAGADYIADDISALTKLLTADPACNFI
jgi:phosphoglycolate phosphatase